MTNPDQALNPEEPMIVIAGASLKKESNFELESIDSIRGAGLDKSDIEIQTKDLEFTDKKVPRVKE